MKFRSLSLIAALVPMLAACPDAKASPPPVPAAGGVHLEVSADTFKVKALCGYNPTADSLFLASCQTAFTDSTTSTALGTVDVTPVGSMATLLVIRSLAPGQRFTVGVTRRGRNQDGVLSAVSAMVFVGFTAVVGPPPIPGTFPVTICRVGDPGC